MPDYIYRYADNEWGYRDYDIVRPKGQGTFVVTQGSFSKNFDQLDDAINWIAEQRWG